MALNIRLIQKHDAIGIQLLKGAEGLSHLELTLGDGGAVTFRESQDAQITTKPLEVAPAIFSLATETPLLSAGFANSFDLHWDVDVGKTFPTGWTTILWVSHNQAAGTSFAVALTVDSVLDDAGAAVATIYGPDSTYRHESPSAAQALEQSLLDNLIKPMGMSATDGLGRKHYSEYEPATPVGTFGSPMGPIVNANLNFEEYTKLVQVGFLSRGSGANSYRLFLTEAGKRSAGFAL